MRAVIIMGPPGSGKGTQAKLLADRLGLIHFDTGKYIEQVVHDKSKRNNKIIQEQRKLFDSGKLCTPSWVLKITKERASQLAKIGLSVVFSGSPRTFYEAFGYSTEENESKRGLNFKKQKGLMDVLKKYYGKENIFIFNIEIPDKESIKRNSQRLLCSVCGTQILDCKKLKLLKPEGAEILRCPFCAGKLYRRTLDNPETIKTRLKEYKERTQPILLELKKRGYKIIKINGKPLPEKITKSIIKWLI